VLIVGTAVPLSLTVGLAYLYFSGSSFNAITMAAFVIAIGLLVDNAIVVMENIMRYRQMGYSPIESAQKGATEVAVAISTATLTTLVVFVPAIYVEEGELAMYMRTFSWPMCIALAASLFVSLTIIPLLASQALRWKGWTRRIGFRRRSVAQIGAPEAASHFPTPPVRRGWLTRVYAASLAWVLHHRLATSLMMAALGGVTIVFTAGQVGMRMLPPVDNRIVEVRVSLDPQYDWDRVQLTMDTVGAILDMNREELGISNVYVSPNGRGGEVRAFLYTIEEAKARDKTLLATQKVEDLLREQLPSLLPGGEVRLSSAPSVRFSQRSFGLRMRGDDLQSLLRFANQFARLMENQPEVIKARVEMGNPNEEIHLDVDEVMADNAGMSPADVAMTINAALSGTRLFNIPRDHGDMPVFAQLKSEDRATLNDLEEITIADANGLPVPLRRLVTKTRAEGPNDILREDGKNVVSITAETTTENMSEFKEDVTRLSKSFRLPRGYTIDFGEKLSELERTLQNFHVMLILAVILIYIVMGAIFESFLLPFSILISVPLSFIGVAWTLYLSDSMMDVIALIGTILMCGLVVNNGIVLIDHINQLRKAGLPRTEAIVRAGINRLRPIGMTALTTILGCIPLAMGSKFQDLAFESLGRTMIGGLTVGTLITLLATPLLYTLLEDAQNWCARFLSGILLFSRK
jgi:HAE1 family hydrophobic/amphiphilic exporter-1